MTGQRRTGSIVNFDLLSDLPCASTLSFLPVPGYIGETEEMSQRSKWEIVAILFLFISLLWKAVAGATEIRIPPIAAHPSQTIDVPIIVDEIDNLAGVVLFMS